MKTKSRSFVNIVRLLLTTGFLATFFLPFHSASASPLIEDFIANPAAEEYMLNELIASGYADLALAFPNPNQRVISTDFFLSTLNNPEIQGKKSIYIANTTIAGVLDASASNIPYILFLNVVSFTDYIIFSNSVFTSLTILDSTFQQGIEFQNINAGDFDLRNNIFQHGINLYGAQIGELTLVDSQILGTEPMRDGLPYPSEFRRMSVSSNANFNGTSFEGVAYFEESEFHTLEMWSTQFAGDANFSNVLIDRSGAFIGTQFLKNANFDQTNFGNATFQSAAFAGNANFEQANFGDAAFEGVTFNGTTSFKDCSVRGDLNFNGATFSSTDSIVDLSEMEVADTTSLEDISAASGFDMKYGSFKDLKVSVRDSGVITTLDLTQAEISGQFAIRSTQIDHLDVNGIHNDGTATLDHLTITESLDLQNARLNLLVVNELKWPETPQAFNLRGMTFSDIDLGERGLTEETWRELLLLVNTSVYSPQTYKAISQFFMDKGYPDWAAEMELAGKRRERDEILTPLSGAWLWSWFLDIFSGYGFRPYLAFIWSALVIAIGAIVYRRREDMIPVDQAEAKVEYNPAWYSFALFLPYIDLGIQGKWEPNPERKWARYYKYVHLLLGWILMPIALLAFGGVLR
jgi:uncharacterized protein YjbI with pentapeptide repeats